MRAWAVLLLIAALLPQSHISFAEPAGFNSKAQQAPASRAVGCSLKRDLRSRSTQGQSRSSATPDLNLLIANHDRIHRLFPYLIHFARQDNEHLQKLSTGNIPELNTEELAQRIDFLRCFSRDIIPLIQKRRSPEIRQQEQKRLVEIIQNAVLQIKPGDRQEAFGHSTVNAQKIKTLLQTRQKLPRSILQNREAQKYAASLEHRMAALFRHFHSATAALERDICLLSGAALENDDVVQIKAGRRLDALENRGIVHDLVINQCRQPQ